MGRAPLSKKIFVVQAKLLQARARYVGQFEFRFFGRASGLATFSYVLYPVARCLHHLVAGTTALFNVTAQ